MSEFSETDAAKVLHEAALWRKCWTRVLALDLIAGQWLLDTRREAHGPFATLIGEKPLLYYRLVDTTEPVDSPNRYRQLFWEFNGVDGIDPYVMNSKGERFQVYEFARVPDLNKLDEEMPIDTAAELWRNLVSRVETLQSLWVEHVDHWKAQKEHGAFTYGVTIHADVELNLCGFDRRTGDLVLEFNYPSDQENPTVTYFDEQ